MKNNTMYHLQSETVTRVEQLWTKRRATRQAGGERREKKSQRRVT